MKFSKREEFMLWRLLEFPLHRYLLSFRKGCGNGYERAERHIEISKILWEVWNVRTALPEHHGEWMAIHDLIADKITDHLPRIIGFDPTVDLEYDWDILTDKFFRKLTKLNIKSGKSLRNAVRNDSHKTSKSGASDRT